MKTKLIAFIYFLLFLPACAYSIRYDGTYEGKVVDAETGKPIEGVVVLGVWYKEAPTVAGAVSSYYDARETVTDKNGNFNIPGKGLKILSNVGVMNVLIFKAGYEYMGMWTWGAFKEDELLRKKIQWEGKRVIIPLKKLTMEERKEEGPPSRPSIPVEQMRKLTIEINKERIDIGLMPFELGGADK